MYSAENYLWGWIAYSSGALCLLLCLWLLVRKVSVAAIRHIVMMFAVIAFFTPVTAYRDDPHLAPAFFVSLYEGLLASGDDMGFQRGLAPIVAIAAIGLMFYCLVRVLMSRFKKSSSPAPADSED